MKKTTASTDTPAKKSALKGSDIFSPRAYLDKKDRRQMLLNSAADLVITHDWKTLTMSAVAIHGKVSRQLVYQHFNNLESLLIDTAAHLFSDLWRKTAAVIQDLEIDLQTTIRKAAKLTLDLEPGHGDALWQILAGVGRDSEEMRMFYQQMRAIVIELWLPRISRDLQLKKAIARGFIWTHIMTLWGLRQMMRDGVISRKQANDLFDLHITRTVLSQVKAATPPE